MAPGLCLLPMLLGLAGALPEALAIQEVCQHPRYTAIQEGGSINITCSPSSPEQVFGVFLKQNSGPSQTNVIYYEDRKKPTVDKTFLGRVAFSGSHHNLTITLQHLRQADTNTYVCQFSMEMNNAWGPCTVVVVTDTLSHAANTCQEAWLTHVTLSMPLAVGFLLFGLGLGAVCVLRRTQIKKLCCRKQQSSACVVYEDMSCSRHNTMSIPNQYQ